MIRRTKEELEFLITNGIDPKKLKTRWAWVTDKEKAITFYRDVIYPHFNRVPKRDEIDAIGYRGFRNAVRRIGTKINDIILELGLVPNLEFKYFRWILKI